MSHVKPKSRARAFTLVEATISTVVLGAMLVAALSLAGSARLGQYKLSARSLGLALAQDLMSEIQQQAYEDPNGAAVFGVETGEQTGSRIDFDDVDDYHNWSTSPPQDRNGNTLPGFEAWERSVQVEWVEPANLTQTSASDQGVKCVRITVKHNGIPEVSWRVFQTSVWPSLFADGSND